ncbi:NAD(P)H-dependent oxidoreductase [Halobacillus shinanisalinarum]|uniref:NAD(P)H-dependent oxidoreductase n=1 Tax=Halobacillus shinanisalinarum TaxID=2932258 RepID=A0ABY4GWC2_9BACI|nr:NAD(P)H-dependent oxidoreductase [Halobacillus shinanisalinarum]UOQ91682.1 NAD(P)H-dependent oxidoreductase [Halobacillus shinanisalinarum]
MNILVINGHEHYNHSKGDLNQTLFNYMVEKFTRKYQIQTTVIQDGYGVKEEQEKVKWSDIVIYQTPIYCYSVPALFKKYFDTVHEYGVFFEGSPGDYGTGGLLHGKRYMFSTTWNAPRSAFNDPSKFFEGRNVEEILFHLHLIHKYTGMKSIETFACFNVKKAPDLEHYKNELDAHINRFIPEIT